MMMLRLDGALLGWHFAWWCFARAALCSGGFFSFRYSSSTLSLPFHYLCATLCTALARPFCCSLLHLCAGIIFNTRIGRGIACYFVALRLAVLRSGSALLGGFFSFRYLFATLSRPFCCSLLHLCAGIIFNTRIGRGIACCFVALCLDGAALGWRFARVVSSPFATLLPPFRHPFSTLALRFALLFCLNCVAPSRELCYCHQGALPRCQGCSQPFKRLRRVINRPEVFYICPIFINLFCQKFGS